MMQPSFIRQVFRRYFRSGFLTTFFSVLLTLSACDNNVPTNDGPSSSTTLTPEQQQRISILQNQFNAIKGETQTVNDMLALKRLQHAYGYYLEKGLWPEVVAMFTDDASIEFGNEGVYIGKNRIEEYFKRLLIGQEKLAKGEIYAQYFVMPLITLSEDGQSANARWKDMIMMGKYGESAYWGDGVYENEYVKQNGVWKISKLHRYTTYIAPYKEGWKESEHKPDISHVVADFPPDQPPTFDYEPYPGVFIPPYHNRPQVPADDPLTQGVMLRGDAPDQ